MELLQINDETKEMETINNVLRRLEMSEAAAEVEKVSELIKVSRLRNNFWDFFGGNSADRKSPAETFRQ